MWYGSSSSSSCPARPDSALLLQNPLKTYSIKLQAGQAATNRRQIRVVKMQSKWRTANAINCEICCWINKCTKCWNAQYPAKVPQFCHAACINPPSHQKDYTHLLQNLQKISLKSGAELLVKSQFVWHVSACRRCWCCLSLSLWLHEGYTNMHIKCV